jgi:hypothetical protein
MVKKGLKQAKKFSTKKMAFETLKTFKRLAEPEKP